MQAPGEGVVLAGTAEDANVRYTLSSQSLLGTDTWAFVAVVSFTSAKT